MSNTKLPRPKTTPELERIISDYEHAMANPKPVRLHYSDREFMPGDLRESDFGHGCCANCSDPESSAPTSH